MKCIWCGVLLSVKQPLEQCPCGALVCKRDMPKHQAICPRARRFER